MKGNYVLKSYSILQFLCIDFREKHQFVAALIYTFIGWFLYVPWPGIKPTTWEYWDNTLTKWATRPGWKSYTFWIKKKVISWCDFFNLWRSSVYIHSLPSVSPLQDFLASVRPCQLFPGCHCSIRAGTGGGSSGHWNLSSIPINK